jgi:transposase
MESIHKCVAGLDVHKAIIVCTVLQSDSTNIINKKTKQFSTFRKDLVEMARWLSSYPIELSVMESTSVYWKSPFEVLEEAGIPVFVANARHIKNVPGRKTDVKDSEWLANLARCGLLVNSFIPPRDIRELRMVTRYRRKLVGMRASEKNRLQKVLEDGGIRLSCVVSDIDGVSAKEMIASLIEGTFRPENLVNMARGQLKKKTLELTHSLEGNLSDRHRFLLKQVRGHIDALNEQIKEIDSQIVAAMKPYKQEWQALQTIPGIDSIGAAMLLTEIGKDMSRFGNADRLCSWAGICPGSYESAGKRKSGRTLRANVYIKTLLCEFAQSARRSNSQFKSRYEALVVRRGYKRSIIAVAHQILRMVFHVIKNKAPYKDPQIDYKQLIVDRNASRWIRTLKEYGYLDKIRGC